MNCKLHMYKMQKRNIKLERRKDNVVIRDIQEDELQNALSLVENILSCANAVEW